MSGLKLKTMNTGSFTVPTSNGGAIDVYSETDGGTGPSFTTTQLVWIAPWGSDSTGDGSEGNPWQTVLHAQTVLLALPGPFLPSPLIQYTVLMYSGTYSANVALEAFINLVALDPSNHTAGNYPAILDGNVTLGATYGGIPTGQFALVTNLEIRGTVTLDYIAASSSTGSASFTNCMIDGDVAVTQGSSNTTEFHDVEFVANFSQVGGFVDFYNCNGQFGTLLVQAPAPGGHSSPFFFANSGSWQGNVSADQNGNDSVSVILNSQGFSMSRGVVQVTATAAHSPIIDANEGDLPENCIMNGTAATSIATLSAEMRISHQFADVAPTGTTFGAGVVTTLGPFLVPFAKIGVTNIETMHCFCTPIGNWQSLLGTCVVWFTYVQSGTDQQVFINVLNPTAAPIVIPGATVVNLNFYAYLPGSF